MSYDVTKKDNAEVLCPLNEPDCRWLNELVKLRRENEQLQSLVTTDTLTGLNNYRFFQQYLQREMERTVRGGRPTSLIIIDLDFFKAINDEFGHEAGNHALKLAASVFSKAIRSSDVVCRFGGEEFVIILPQTRLPTAVGVAERVRVWLEKSVVEYEQSEINLTASFGVGVFSGESGITLEKFVDTVDSYLYEAKHQGRNRVCHPDFGSVPAPTSVTLDEKAALFSDSRDEQSE